MADLIERDYLIGKFEDTGTPALSEMGKGYDLGIKAALRVVKKAPAVNRWIPCSKRLPEKNQTVIVCCYGSDLIVTQDGETIEDAIKRTNEEIVNVTLGFIGSDGWYGADWFPMMVIPTYWMPLPEPPERGVNDG